MSRSLSLHVKKAPVVEALQSLCSQSGGLLKPETVVDAARDELSPLHPYFEWDDTKAAEMARNFQARLLINQVYVQIQGPDEKPRMAKVFVSLKSDRYNGQFGGGYRKMVDVLTDRDMRHQLIKDAMADMDSFSLRYNNVRELTSVFSAMKKVKEKLVKVK